MMNKLRPQILFAVIVLGVIGVMLISKGETGEAAGVAGMIAAISQRILESQDKP